MGVYAEPFTATWFCKPLSTHDTQACCWYSLNISTLRLELHKTLLTNFKLSALLDRRAFQDMPCGDIIFLCEIGCGGENRTHVSVAYETRGEPALSLHFKNCQL